MADVSFTATAIKAGANAVTQMAQLGEAGITQGMALYQSAEDNKWYKGDCTNAAKDAVSAFALGAGGTDQWIVIQTAGEMTCDGLTLSQATSESIYVLSESGKIAPSDDLAEDDYVTVVGVAKSATNLLLVFGVSGVQAAA